VCGSRCRIEVNRFLQRRSGIVRPSHLPIDQSDQHEYLGAWLNLCCQQQVPETFFRTAKAGERPAPTRVDEIVARKDPFRALEIGNGQIAPIMLGQHIRQIDHGAWIVPGLLSRKRDQKLRFTPKLISRIAERAENQHRHSHQNPHGLA
jgi:hypothetical protein